MIENIVEIMIKKRQHNKKAHNHAAVFFKGNYKKHCDIMTYGANTRFVKPYIGTIHAEKDALDRLPLRSNKKLKTVNVCIIKISKTGKLGDSQPCFHCISNLMKEAPKKGYRVEWIFFSKQSGQFEKCRLNKFLNTYTLFLSSFYKHKNSLTKV